MIQMLDLSDLKYTPHEKAWTTWSADGAYLIVVAGTPEAPDMASFALAEQILDNIEPHIAAAVAYLHSWFYASGRADEAANWSLNQIEFGRTGDEPSNEFMLLFDHAIDDYGLWHVIMRFEPQAPTTFVPIQFGRRQQ